MGGKAVRPISGANLGFEGAAGTIADYIGIVLELPSRLLMTGDEFLKQINYRGRLYTNALRQYYGLETCQFRFKRRKGKI